MILDVIIAGAGPAGIATAVTLVRQQGLDPRRLVVLERSHFPRPKPCGGGLTGRAALAMAELGLQLRVPSVACAEAEVVYGQMRRVVPLGRPVCVVRRDDFDADLVAQARALGIEVREGEGVRSLVAPLGPGDPVRLETTGGHVLASKVLVGADGVGSLVRRHLMEGHPASVRQPLRLARLELPATGTLPGRMVYDFSAFGEGLRGYVWLFPVPGGRVNVGIMHYPVSELGGRELDRLLQRALARFGVSMPGPARGWPAWPYDARAPVSAAGLLVVGDAAGIDALTGEGIAVGFEQALVAGQHIARGLRDGDLRFATYRRALRQATVGRELVLDGRLARMLYRSRDHRRWLSLVMLDDKMLNLYAARVAGTEILADRKLALLGTLARHGWQMGRRRRQLAELSAA